MIYLVLYENHKIDEEKDYTQEAKFKQALVDNFNHEEVMDNVWLVSSDNNAHYIYDFLIGYLHGKDLLFVAQIKEPSLRSTSFYGRISSDVAAWLRENFSLPS